MEFVPTTLASSNVEPTSLRLSTKRKKLAQLPVGEFDYFYSSVIDASSRKLHSLTRIKVSEGPGPSNENTLNFWKTSYYLAFRSELSVNNQLLNIEVLIEYEKFIHGWSLGYFLVSRHSEQFEWQYYIFALQRESYIIDFVIDSMFCHVFISPWTSVSGLNVIPLLEWQNEKFWQSSCFIKNTCDQSECN